MAAALAVLADMDARHKPARLALKAWADGARYAGAKDRAFVSGLVLDVLRRRRSLAWRIGEESDRARVLGVKRLEVQTLKANDPDAVAFFNACGFVPGDATVLKLA